jgi:hypothetical protein
MVERGSVQHGARLDEEMAEEVASLIRGAPMESRAREDLEAEPPGDGEPTPDSLITAGPDARSGGLSHDDVELRSEIARHLRPSAFPAQRDDVLLIADQEGASADLLSLLASLPREVDFHQISDIWRALGGEVEHRDEAADTMSEPAAGIADPDNAGGLAAIEVVEIAVGVIAEPRSVAEPEPPMPDTVADGTEPSAAPGCNLISIAAHATADTGGMVGRIIRRALPFV